LEYYYCNRCLEKYDLAKEPEAKDEAYCKKDNCNGFLFSGFMAAEQRDGYIINQARSRIINLQDLIKRVFKEAEWHEG